MNIEELRECCLNLKGVEESFPFDEETLVFKVMGKIFCLAGLENNPVQFNVKCSPETAIELRERFSGVRPGYHMNKKHWNTIAFDGSITDEQARQWVLDSYRLIVESLPRKAQEELKNRP
ncbi:MAG: MmcQ/YjbR family DNA-binding protein [Bacteroidetes bacterium]|nr:MAG: MmcQ/YjbR family DNA-binding protein [Bacteroidota bacterium]